MVTKLSQETQKILGIKTNRNLSASALAVVTDIITVRFDDLGVLLGLLFKMELQKVLDKHIPKHWKQRNLSWGWTIGMKLAYVLSESDLRCDFYGNLCCGKAKYAKRLNWARNKFFL